MKNIKRKRYYHSRNNSLHGIIGNLVSIYQPAALNRNILFKNQVAPELVLRTDTNVFTSLIGSLLEIISRCSQDTCIYISALSYSDTILIYVRDINTFNSYAILSKLNHLQRIAGLIGGKLEGQGLCKKETTIAISLQNETDKSTNLPNCYIVHQLHLSIIGNAGMTLPGSSI